MPKLTLGPQLFHRRAGRGSSYGEIGTIERLGTFTSARPAQSGPGVAAISRHHHRTFGIPRPGHWSVFEDPYCDARCSEVFWHPDLCREVLPLFGDLRSVELPVRGSAIEAFACNTAIHRDARGTRHVLFAKEGRSLQLLIVSSTHRHAVWTTEAVVPVPLLAARFRALKRLNDLFTYRQLRPHLYPPHPRASRLIQVLRALDASLDRASYREIGIALYGKRRIERDWNDPCQNLRDQVRRAVHRGHTLMSGGYRDLLR